MTEEKKPKSKIGCLLKILGLILFIGIFAATMFPIVVITTTREPGVSHATNTAYQLKNAITTYHIEYRRFPISQPITESDTAATSGPELMNILLAQSDELNPRGIVFYSGRPARENEGKFVKGVQFAKDGMNALLLDPWGNLYRVRIDTNHDGQIEDPANPGQSLRSNVIVWSAGPDGDFNSWKDNPKTW